MSAAAPCAQAAVYRRRRPERTVLYQTVQAHLETWLACKCEDNEDGRRVPPWVEREFRTFLDCGILARGFACARCGSCGQDFVVGFSCKTRCLCPSCNARRMVEVAAHLVDHVFPRVPVRQWVLSLPTRPPEQGPCGGWMRKRVLALFERRGLLTPEVVADMREWEHGGGFSLDATIRIEPNDRAGLERLLRYCARPAFARERLCWDRTGVQLLYELPKPRPDGQIMLRLAPSELLDRLAVLIPPPRSHRHRYCGVLAPNARLRPMVTARTGLPVEPTEAEQAAAASGEPTRAAAEPAPTVSSRCSSL